MHVCVRAHVCVYLVVWYIKCSGLSHAPGDDRISRVAEPWPACFVSPTLLPKTVPNAVCHVPLKINPVSFSQLRVRAHEIDSTGIVSLGEGPKRDDDLIWIKAFFTHFSRQPSPFSPIFLLHLPIPYLYHMLTTRPHHGVEVRLRPQRHLLSTLQTTAGRLSPLRCDVESNVHLQIPRTRQKGAGFLDKLPCAPEVPDQPVSFHWLG